VVAAVGRGANLAVFGANTAYWRARLAGRTLGLAGQPDRRDGRPRFVVVHEGRAARPARAFATRAGPPLASGIRPTRARRNS
jgi:hypothetical protein